MSDTFCVAIPPILIAFSVALLATFVAVEENSDQPYIDCIKI